MLRGFYTAATGILMQQRKINVLTNNVANAETPGYRASRVVSSTFQQELMTRLEGSNTENIGSNAQIQVVSEVPTRFDPSSLEETGRPLDFALEGEGFFNVQAEDADGNATAVRVAVHQRAMAARPAAIKGSSVPKGASEN